MLSTGNFENTQEETQDKKDELCSPPPFKKQRIIGALRFRASKKDDVKSAAMYSSSPFQERSPNSFQRIKHALQNGVSEVANNRPIKEIIKVSAKGTPRQVRTPGDTTLFLKKDYGIVRIFTEESFLPVSPARPMLTELSAEQKNQIEQSSAYQEVKSNPATFKHQELWITAEQIEKAKEEIKLNHGKRICSQNKVMVQEGFGESKGSANNYGQEFIEKQTKRYYEWLHLVQHRLLASRAQKQENLVCGTFYANTDMMFIEFQHSLLSSCFPKGYKLEVTVNVVQGLPGSQFSTIIDYIIETDQFRLPFRFNGQSDVLPNLFNLDYVEALVLASIQGMGVNKKGYDENWLLFFSRNNSRKRKLVYEDNIDNSPPLQENVTNNL